MSFKYSIKDNKLTMSYKYEDLGEVEQVFTKYEGTLGE
jgi:hypothetical protein